MQSKIESFAKIVAIERIEILTFHFKIGLHDGTLAIMYWQANDSSFETAQIIGNRNEYLKLH